MHSLLIYRYLDLRKNDYRSGGWMLVQNIFLQRNTVLQTQLIKANPLATIVHQRDDVINADHIPLFLPVSDNTGLIDENLSSQKLLGHIAKANPLSNAESPVQVLVIFQGEQTYISPNWYPTKQEHGKVVPTWNYSVLHIHGQLKFKNMADWKVDMLNNMTAQMEQTEVAVPWQLNDAPQDYIDKQLKGIVGIEIEIKSIEGKWKMSQNQPEKNQEGVIAGLSASQSESAKGVLRRMQELRSKSKT